MLAPTHQKLGSLYSKPNEAAVLGIPGWCDVFNINGSKSVKELFPTAANASSFVFNFALSE